ncbi:MAG: isoprenylcysteine carboxylmethyltransferase family protein [Anaerolineae bacterium]|nr:isoprenylcysteine carboxylmethyltransferase family protein [Anaerolineae bacterium]
MDKEQVEQGRANNGVQADRIVKRFLQVGFQLLLLAAALFLSSWRWNWGMAWAFLGVSAAVLIVGGVGLLKINPELVAERTRMGEGTKGWDKVLTALYGLMGIATLIVAGLDTHFGWSGGVPLAVQLAALALFALGDLFAFWAMWSNAFFATTVRIQGQRGHAVATNGPYRYLRHPGYSGWLVCNIVSPLILDSLWAFIPAALTVSIILIRTAAEDRTLQEELPGYAEYAQRVRHRLLPGVW